MKITKRNVYENTRFGRLALGCKYAAFDPMFKFEFDIKYSWKYTDLKKKYILSGPETLMRYRVFKKLACPGFNLGCLKNAQNRPVLNDLCEVEEIHHEESLMQYRSIVDEIVQNCMCLELTDQKSAETAVDVIARSREILVKIEDAKKSITSEARKMVTAMNSIAKKFVDKLELVDDALSVKLCEYAVQNDLELIRTELGTCRSKVELDFEVDDISLVPAEYLMVDEKKVKMAIKLGIRRIPGMKAVEKQVVEVRRAG